MKRFYFVINLLFVLTGVPAYAEDGSTNQPASAPNATGRYQQVDLNPETPCNCKDKTERYFEMYMGVQEKDMRQYRMVAYKFSLNGDPNQASKLFRALEEDPAVMKISIREWSYFMLFTTKDFDKQSFDAAARNVFPEFSEVTPGDYFLYKNAELLKIYNHVFPLGYHIPSSSN